MCPNGEKMIKFLHLPPFEKSYYGEGQLEYPFGKQ